MSVLEVIRHEVRKYHATVGKAPTRLYIGRDTFYRMRQQEKHLWFTNVAGDLVDQIMGLEIHYVVEPNHLFVC